MHCTWLKIVTICNCRIYDYLSNIARILLIDKQRRFTFSEALKQLRIVFDNVNNDSDAEASSNSKTESIVDNEKVPLDEKLFDIDVFEEENKDAGSDEYQEHNDDDGSSEDEAQVAITAGNATYYNNPFPNTLRRRNMMTQQPQLLLLLSMKSMLSKYFTDLQL